MKKILTLFTLFVLLAFTSCTGPEGPPGRNGEDALKAMAFEIQGNFIYDNFDGYIISDNFSKYIGGDLYANESVLVYRLEGENNNGSDIWQLIPRTLYFDNNEVLDYDYNFSKEYFTIFAGGNYLASFRPDFLNNQVFRFVIIPSNFNASVNKKNYLEVMKALDLDDDKIQQIQF